MQYFLVFYATDVFILTLVVLWHINFIIATGLTGAILIFVYGNTDKMLIDYTNNG